MKANTVKIYTDRYYKNEVSLFDYLTFGVIELTRINMSKGTIKIYNRTRKTIEAGSIVKGNTTEAAHGFFNCLGTKLYYKANF